MTTILLIKPDDVYDSLGINPDMMEDAEPSVRGAIVRATIKLEGLLRTKLTPQTITDTFFVSGAEGAPLNQHYTFFLSAGFVQQTPVIVEIADEVDGPYSAITASMVHRDHGKVLLPCGNPDGLLGKYVRISYTSGFPSSTDVPDEIKQALLCYLPSVLLSSAAASGDPKAYAVSAAKATSADSLGGDMASGYIRVRGNSLKPLFSAKS